MITIATPLNEIRQLGLQALLEKLGPVGMVRFLQQFETGQGDYTTDRGQWLVEADLDALLEKIQKAPRGPPDPSPDQLQGSCAIPSGFFWCWVGEPQ
jgi:hypothetical protein